MVTRKERWGFVYEERLKPGGVPFSGGHRGMASLGAPLG